MTFRIEVTYAAGNTQEHPGLTAAQMGSGAFAFLRDLVNLQGEGVTRVVVAIEDDAAAQA